MLDLVVRGGTVVTAGSLSVCDVGVQGGIVVQLGGAMQGRRELDARDRYVFPGGVDVHVHLTSVQEPGPDNEVWVDDFYHGSRAALAGGITTLGNMTFQRPGETLRAALERDGATAARLAAVDYLLHPVLTDPTPQALAELPALAAEGHTSLKLFLVLDNFETQVDAYLRAMQLAGRSGMLTLLHCEDGALVRACGQALREAGRRAPRYWPESRPIHTEVVAVERAIALARTVGAPIYLVHLSSAQALASCRRARAEGLPVYVETRPLYLFLTREVFEQPDGARYVGAPPPRGAADQRALWHALAHGDVQCLCSDHAPWMLRQKLDPTLDVTTARQGVAELETLRPLLFSEGVWSGRLSLNRFVELTATNAARLFGLYPRKGTIAIGSDADLVVWDADARRTVNGAAMQSRADYSVYDGWEVQGWPLHTISRGEVVVEGGEVTAQPGRGRWLRRTATMPL